MLWRKVLEHQITRLPSLRICISRTSFRCLPISSIRCHLVLPYPINKIPMFLPTTVPTSSSEVEPKKQDLQHPNSTINHFKWINKSCNNSSVCSLQVMGQFNSLVIISKHPNSITPNPRHRSYMRMTNKDNLQMKTVWPHQREAITILSLLMTLKVIIKKEIITMKWKVIIWMIWTSNEEEWLF